MISGPVAEAISKSTVEAGPGECPFELRHAFTKERATGNWYKHISWCIYFISIVSDGVSSIPCNLCCSFRVMTYNILAGMYSDTEAAKSELFAHCPSYALDIDYRKQLLMKEILGILIMVFILPSPHTHFARFPQRNFLFVHRLQCGYNLPSRSG